MVRKSTATTKAALKTEIQQYMDDNYNYSMSPRPVPETDYSAHLASKLAVKQKAKREAVQRFDREIGELERKIKAAERAKAARAE
jgi:hypothetical protein